VNTRAPEKNQPNPKVWNQLKRDYGDLLNEVYKTALKYVQEKRDSNELRLFKEMFNASTWTENNARSFVSLYEESTNRGIRSHRDWVSFCAVTVCLEGKLTSDGNLVITQFDSENLDCEGNDHIVVKIAQGGIIAYGRFYHHVAFCKRTSTRCTWNFFF
jgi:hypothetical protein